MIKKKFLFLFLILTNILSCSHEIKNKQLKYELNSDNYNIGQKLELKYNNLDFNDEKINIQLVNSYNEIIKNYNNLNNNGNIIISRLLDFSNINNINDVYLKFNIDENSFYIKLNINTSIEIKSLCATNTCEGFSGNIIENIENNLYIKMHGEAFNAFIYEVYIGNKLYAKYEHIYNSYTDYDLHKLIFPKVNEKNSSYIALLKITAFNFEKNINTETVLPIRVVRPLEVKHYGKYELAETYEPVPVTGCIPGTIGSRVEYSESTSETRQNSVSIVLSKDMSQSLSNSIDNTNSEDIMIAETKDLINTTSLSNSETLSETNTESYSESNSNNFNFSTSNGENWSWSFNEGNSSTNETSNGTNTNINGSITTTVSGEGSLPFLAKASGSVAATVGASYDISNSTSNSSTNSSERGYITGQSNETQRQYGSANEISTGSELSGSYAISNENTLTISQGSSQYSGRVWNMSETISSGKIITQGDSESIDNTIVSSSSSETTFSYGGFIPNTRVGKFFRQTSRYTKLSEIISYDINGFPKTIGYISMNSWAWAPELVISNSCDNLSYSNFLIPKCYIQPCGE